MGYFVPEMTGSRAVGNEKSRGEFFSAALRRNVPSSRSKRTATQGFCVVASATCTSGVRYYGYRHYSPELGRWPSRDPIEERGGITLYVSFDNEPIANIDKLGLFVSMQANFVSFHASAEFNPAGTPYVGWDQAGIAMEGRVAFSKPAAAVASNWGDVWSWMTSSTMPSRANLRNYPGATDLQWSSFLLIDVDVCACCPLNAVRVNWTARAELAWSAYDTMGSSLVELNNRAVALAARGVGPVVSPQIVTTTGSFDLTVPPWGCLYSAFRVNVVQNWYDAGLGISGGTSGSARFNAQAECAYSW